MRAPEMSVEVQTVRGSELSAEAQAPEQGSGRVDVEIVLQIVGSVNRDSSLNCQLICEH